MALARAGRRFKVTLEYDGTDFHGFQFQAGTRSVQEAVEHAILQLTGLQVRIDAAGRTDTGVHALGQVISFTVATAIPGDRMVAALNSVLPPDVAAVRSDEVEAEFHARFSAKARSYLYVMHERQVRSPVWDRFTCRVQQRVDSVAMHAAAAALCGEHDFAAWANSSKEVRTTVRTVSRCSVRRRGSFILLSIESNGFLRGMVRNIAGTLLEVGAGCREGKDIQRITMSRCREMAGHSAPAAGLFLYRVRY